MNTLQIHISNISYSLLNQFTSKGVILTQHNDHIEEDLVSTHHTIELLKELNPNIFLHYIEKSISYLANPDNRAMDSMFALDTLSSVLPKNKQVKSLIDSILHTQLSSGAFTKFTAFLHGGDFFSTLWCLKILINTGYNEYHKRIQKGFEYIVRNLNDDGISANQKGFFYLLSRDFEVPGYDRENLRIELLKYIKETVVSPENLLWQLYIYEDLLCDADEKTREVLWEFFSKAFGLNEEPTGLPTIFKELQDLGAESVFYQCLARFCITSLRFTSSEDAQSISYEVNKLLQSNGQNALYIASTREKQLKEFLSVYGGIHKEFSKFDDILQEIWKTQSSFEKSIFIMMPFKDELGYNETTKIIKSTCKKRGFKAIRIDDKDRQFHHTLWDNLVINLLACKYAIAIYVSDQIVDLLDEKSPKMFPNPNVALEFGFFTSRGQKILLLRDEKSPIPTDLQGFIWNGFSIKKPGKDVKSIVNEFLDNLEEDGKKTDANKH